MNKITKTEYDLFCKHGSELLWVSDSLRHKRPKGTSAETDKMFIIIEQVDHRLEMISTGMYSQKMINENVNEIKMLKPNFSEEVFKILNEKYK